MEMNCLCRPKTKLMETEGIRMPTAGKPGPTELTKPGRKRMNGWKFPTMERERLIPTLHKLPFSLG